MRYYWETHREKSKIFNNLALNISLIFYEINNPESVKTIEEKLVPTTLLKRWAPIFFDFFDVFRDAYFLIIRVLDKVKLLNVSDFSRCICSVLQVQTLNRLKYYICLERGGYLPMIVFDTLTSSLLLCHHITPSYHYPYRVKGVYALSWPIWIVR